jgi:hypothetical protein
MKPIAALLLLFILPCSIFGQLKKGQWLIGGIADFSHGSSDEHSPFLDHESKVTMYRFMPGAGYFVIDGLCLGARFNISGQKSEEDNAGITTAYNFVSSYDQKMSGFGISPFIRYYFLPDFAKVNVFVDGSYTYATEKRTMKMYQENSLTGGPTGPPNPPSITQSYSKIKDNGNYYSLAAGPAFFIGRNISFELLVGYTMGKIKDPERKKGTLQFGTGFQVHLGK